MEKETEMDCSSVTFGKNARFLGCGEDKRVRVVGDS